MGHWVVGCIHGKDKRAGEGGRTTRVTMAVKRYMLRVGRVWGERSFRYFPCRVRVLLRSLDKLQLLALTGLGELGRRQVASFILVSVVV